MIFGFRFSTRASQWLVQFLSLCISKPLHSSRRDHQGAATLHKRQKSLSNSGIAIIAPALLFAFTCAAHALTPHSACTPSFSLEHGKPLGWLGADAAYSIPLPDGRDVWIFGDTLYGEHRVVNGNQPQMVRNSIGVSTCDAGKFNLKYIIRKDAAGHPRDFFTAQHPHTWYWALDGFVAHHNLWVTLLCVRNAPAIKPGAMSFETCGSDLARISNLGPDPQKWNIAYFPLVPDGAHAYPSATAVDHDHYAYIFAQYESGTRPLLATRIPFHGLNAPKANLQYLTASGQWKPGFDPTHAKEVMHRGSSELSIRYHPDLHRWLAVMFAPNGFSSKILLRSAPTLTGPWTAGRVIYNVPEMQPTHPGYDKNTFCYAGKEHPEFERHDLVFTYVCNTFAVPKLATNTAIYYPQVVRMPLPALPKLP